jgi:hypothetical protein
VGGGGRRNGLTFPRLIFVEFLNNLLGLSEQGVTPEMTLLFFRSHMSVQDDFVAIDPVEIHVLYIEVGSLFSFSFSFSFFFSLLCPVPSPLLL